MNTNNDVIAKEPFNQCKHVRDQIQFLPVGILMEVDLGPMTVSRFRMNIGNFTADTSKKFKTKFDKKTEALYVLRIQ